MKVRRGRYFLPNEPEYKVRGKIVGAAFDEIGNLWAYAIVDEKAPLVSPYCVQEYEAWPMDTDTYICMVQSWVMIPNGMGIVLQPSIPIFVYSEVVPEVADAVEGD